MSDLDFRYERDGITIEAFQLTAATRYQEGLWPEWMDSRWFMTVNNEEWLDINGNEMKVPKLGWICRSDAGNVEIKTAQEMELWQKVVPNVEVHHPETKVKDEKALLELAAKLKGISVEELEAEQELKKQNPLHVVQSEPPVSVPATDKTSVPVTELVIVLDLFAQGKADGAADALKYALTQRVSWCSCSPGNCEGGDRLGCRQNSPLL